MASGQEQGRLTRRLWPFGIEFCHVKIYIRSSFPSSITRWQSVFVLLLLVLFFSTNYPRFTVTEHV